MRIPKSFFHKKHSDIAVLSAVYCLCIISATLIRWMNYANLLAIGVMMLYVILRKRIAKASLNLLWAGYILVYPLLDAAIRGEVGLSLFTALCYITPMVFMLVTDINVDNFGKLFISFAKGFAWFQAFGVFLGIVSKKLFVIIAYRLLGMWSAKVLGFATDPTVTAYILCFGICVYLVEFLVLDHKNTKDGYRKLASFGILFVALVLTGKRSFLLGSCIMLVIVLLTFYTNSKRKFVATFLGGIAVGILGGGVSLGAYFMGANNALGRMGATIIGLMNDQDVSNMRSTWAEYMAEWSEGREWLGIGWETFKNRINFTQYAGKVPNGHNVYLQIMSEEGYIGLAVFFILMTATVLYAVYNCVLLAKTNDKSAISVSLFSLFSVGLFAIYCSLGNAMYDTIIYLYFFAGIQLLNAAAKARRNALKFQNL